MLRDIFFYNLRKAMKPPNDREQSRQILENFIVLEGLDGAGTTTQLRLAEERLRKQGIHHFCTSEPTSGFIGRIIRSILDHRLDADPRTIALLFAADRTEHVWAKDGGIVAHLDRRELVISDRYLVSSLAYQSLACDFSFVYYLNRRFPLPRHLVFLDTPVEMSQRRLAGRSGQHKELFEAQELQARILANYRQAFGLYRDSGMEIHTLDGGGPAEEVFRNFWKIIAGVPMVKA